MPHGDSPSSLLSHVFRGTLPIEWQHKDRCEIEMKEILLRHDAENNTNGVAIGYKTAVSFAILLAIFLVIGVWPAGGNALFVCAFFGALFIYLGSRPNLLHVGLSLAAAAAIAFLYRILHLASVSSLTAPHGFVALVEQMEGAGAFLGAGSIVAMGLDAVWTGSSRYVSALRDSLVLPLFTLLAALCMQVTAIFPHASFDWLLYRFDAGLGLAPGYLAASLFRKVPWLRNGSYLTYKGLLMFPAAYQGWASLKGKAAKINLIHAFVIAGIIGFVLYQICPAIGPRATFGQSFPDHLPAASAVPGSVFMSKSVPNAMPSLHMTWALLVWVAAWELGWFASLNASIFVIFTGFATVGMGEHYLVDLIVSVPLVMMVRGICAARPRLTASGLGLVGAWLVYLRMGFHVPFFLNWLFIVATVVTAALLMRSSAAWSGSQSASP